MTINIKIPLKHNNNINLNNYNNNLKSNNNNLKIKNNNNKSYLKINSNSNRWTLRLVTMLFKFNNPNNLYLMMYKKTLKYKVQVKLTLSSNHQILSPKIIINHKLN